MSSQLPAVLFFVFAVSAQQDGPSLAPTEGDSPLPDASTSPSPASPWTRHGGCVDVAPSGVALAAAALSPGAYAFSVVDREDGAHRVSLVFHTYSLTGLESAAITVRNTSNSVSCVSVGAAPFGKVFIAWCEESEDGDSHTIAARAFTPSGEAASDVLVVASNVDSEQPSVAVAAVEEGFVVTWASRVNGSESRPYGKIYAAVGDVKVLVEDFPLFTVSAGDMSNQQVASMPDGGFAAVWPSSDGIYLRRFSLFGEAAGDEVLVVGSNPVTSTMKAPQVAPLADGVVVAWLDTSLGFAETSLDARLMDGNSTAAGETFTIATGLVDCVSSASVAPADHLNGFVAAWNAYGADRSGHVVAAAFDADGSPLTSSYQLSTGDAYNLYPHVLNTGDFFALSWLWTDGAQTTPRVQLLSANMF